MVRGLDVSALQLPRLIVQWAEFYCTRYKPDLSEYRPVFGKKGKRVPCAN